REGNRRRVGRINLANRLVNRHGRQHIVEVDRVVGAGRSKVGVTRQIGNSAGGNAGKDGALAVHSGGGHSGVGARTADAGGHPAQGAAGKADVVARETSHVFAEHDGEHDGTGISRVRLPCCLVNGHSRRVNVVGDDVVGAGRSQAGVGGQVKGGARG